jgi:DNA-binding MarR family transcriptional regulator
MWRDDPRDTEIRSVTRSRGPGGDPREAKRDPRDVVTRDLELPRGRDRHRILMRHETVDLRESELRTLATVGAFRVVPASDLRDHDGRSLRASAGDLRHLRESGLVRTIPHLMGRRTTSLVTLTERGREVLEALRRDTRNQPSQAFYHGLTKPRELSHDAHVYRAYLRAAERVIARGGQVRRVFLDHELKREYQRFLQAANRGRRGSTGQPLRDQEVIERWAQLHDLPYLDGHVHFPDVRIEYEDRDGRSRVEDVEVETPHYRGAHAAAKARGGFTRFRTAGGRAGGGSSRGSAPFDPHHAEDLL